MDSLLPIKTQFHVGNYQAAINLANSLPHTATAANSVLAQQALTLIYRSYLAQKKYSLLLNDIRPNTTETSHAAIRFMAQYHSATDLSQKETALDGARQLLTTAPSDGQQSGAAMTALLVAELLHLHGDVDEAMRTVAPYARTDLECAASMVQLLLKINRLDLAEKQSEVMHSISEDDTLTQLTDAWLCLATGGEKKYQQAFYVFQELAEIAGGSCKLSTGQAVYNMHTGQWAAAEQLLADALNKSHDDADTLANLAVCSVHTHKPIDVTERYLAQLKDVAPQHALVVDFDLKSSLFDRLQAQFV